MLSTPSISDVRTAGTTCTQGSVQLTFPILAELGPSALLIHPVLAVFRPPVLQYSEYSEYEIYSILGGVHSEYDVYWEHMCIVYY